MKRTTHNAKRETHNVKRTTQIHASRFTLHVSRGGVVALATVLLLGAVLTEIALAGIFVVYVSNNSSFGLRLSSAALAAAQSGIDDALLQLARNKDFPLSGGTRTYTLTLAPDRTVDVCVDVNCDAASLVIAPQRQITAVGRAGLRQRKLKAIVVVDATTGEVRVVSIQEIPTS